MLPYEGSLLSALWGIILLVRLVVWIRGDSRVRVVNSNLVGSFKLNFDVIL